MDERIWLKYPETGGVAAFPEAAAEAWRARGWVDTDPPEETAAPTKDPEPDVPAAEGSATELVTPSAEPVADTGPSRKPRGSAAAGDAEKE